MFRRTAKALLSAVLCLEMAGWGLHAAEPRGRNTGPEIEHDPVRVAARGEPLSLIARVKPRQGQIKTVTLHYTLSRHSAPLHLAMKATGMDLYSGSIPGSFIERAATLYYYIEAEDSTENWTETTWNAVALKDPAQVEAVKPMASAGGTEAEDDETNWGTVALIGLGAVGVVAAAVALSDSGGGGGGGGGAPTEEEIAGTYGGSVVFCQTPAESSTTCNTSATTIVIDQNDNITSDDLAAGTAVSGTVSGDAFSLDVPASQIATGAEGTITFAGTVRSGTISGTITGSATLDGGVISYSGTFTAFLR